MSAFRENNLRPPADTDHGDLKSADALFEAVYLELRVVASRYLRDERVDHTLQATALVHEAYLRLVGGEPIAWHNRAQFFSIASQVMRHILVDHARRHAAGKRGRGATRLSLDDAVNVAAEQHVDLVGLDNALSRLAALDPEQCRVVELRYFGGLTIPEIAEILDVAEITVSRRWKTAKLWLHDALEESRRS
jgi:RNA polymerase sigma-70 factor (ECF subfamily)